MYLFLFVLHLLIELYFEPSQLNVFLRVCNDQLKYIKAVKNGKSFWLFYLEVRKAWQKCQGLLVISFLDE